ncbi:MAG: hypothetical protein KDA84_09090, partial [Planctomycetaceae bacterium]|nr:hypothetical protein [Planctomycetaceae bacterium]
MSNNQNKKEGKQNLSRWIDPSDDSLPLQVINGNQHPSIQSPTSQNATPEQEEPPMSEMLTVPEKEYWKGRIEKRIEDPFLLDRIARQSHERALASLGLLNWQTEWEDIEKQRFTL